MAGKVAIHQPRFVDKKCQECNASFIVRNYIHLKGGGKYCSQKCFGIVRAKYFESLDCGEKRKCRACGVFKDKNEFTITQRDNKRVRKCKQCNREWAREHRLKNPDHYRHMDLKQNYGITPTQYQAFYKDQNGVCAICLKPETSKRGWLHVDHHHLTGKVRGLLCGKCNSGIGLLGEDEKVLASAIQYLTGGR